MVLASPGPPGARPSNSSEAKTFTMFDKRWLSILVGFSYELVTI